MSDKNTCQQCGREFVALGYLQTICDTCVDRNRFAEVRERDDHMIAYGATLAVEQVLSLIDENRDPNDVGPYGRGWREALEAIERDIALRWPAISKANVK